MKKFLMVFALLVLAVPVCAEEVMKFAYADTAIPSCWKENDRMHGILIDIANEAVQKRMGIQVSHQGHPWARCQHLVKQGKVDALITNGPLRKEWAEHGNETVISFDQKLFVKAGGPKLDQLKKVKTLEDLRPFRLGVHRGDGWSKKNIVEKGFNTHLATDHDMLFKLLAKGRVDAVIYEHYVAKYNIKKIGLQDQILELPVVVFSIPFHLVVGKQSPYTKIIPQFDEEIRKMKQDGSFEKILSQYR